MIYCKYSSHFMQSSSAECVTAFFFFGVLSLELFGLCDLKNYLLKLNEAGWKKKKLSCTDVF